MSRHPAHIDGRLFDLARLTAQQLDKMAAFSDPRWATRKQWGIAGRWIAAGQRPVRVKMGKRSRSPQNKRVPLFNFEQTVPREGDPLALLREAERRTEGQR